MLGHQLEYYSSSNSERTNVINEIKPHPSIIYFMGYSACHGLMQERLNSIANILELDLSCTKPSMWLLWHCYHIDCLVPERHNSIASTLELRLSCTNPSICAVMWWFITNNYCSLRLQSMMAVVLIMWLWTKPFPLMITAWLSGIQRWSERHGLPSTMKSSHPVEFTDARMPFDAFASLLTNHWN